MNQISGELIRWNHERGAIELERRPAQLAAQSRGEGSLARARHAREPDATRPGFHAGRSAPGRAERELLEDVEPTEIGEGLAALRDRQPFRSRQPLGLVLPQHLGDHPAVANQGESDRILDRRASQTRGRVEHGLPFRIGR